MAFNKRSLCLFNSTPYGTASKTVNWYGYATADAAATVVAAGYFNDARDKLKVNDVIMVMAVADGTGDWLLLKATAVPASGDVTVAVNAEASGS
jgi:hypothetical protein